MTTYTEDQLRLMRDPELQVAVHALVLDDDLTANTEERRRRALYSFPVTKDGWRNLPCRCREFDKLWGHIDRGEFILPDGRPPKDLGEMVEEHISNWRDAPLSMPLEWCEEEFLTEAGPLEWRAEVFCPIIVHKGFQVIVNDFATMGFDSEMDCLGAGPDMRTALMRAACIVQLRKAKKERTQDERCEDRKAAEVG